ncbi:MAG: ATP-binding cassette domain-containing protein [Oscillospiraceae bacterium]|jgi:oligopeptide transport system ATP-binding protein|nr:ATP-binding cassette domain-containing protein [Oscillospiraceae bacterium]
MTAPLLSVENLAQHFRVRGSGRAESRSVVRAVDGVTFTLDEGRTFGLVGESGCGKSTCARSILRIYTPTSGRITLDGEDITHMSQDALPPIRRKMQMIFQDPYASLNPRMTVRDLIAEPLRAHRPDMSRAEADDAVFEMLEKVGLTREHSGRYPHEFSGGQRQRVGVARALILRPKLVVCDEPISALDVSIQAQIVNLLRDFQEKLGLAYLFIAHDLSMVRYMSDTISVMYLGKLVESSPADDLYARPLHPYTRGLLASIPAGHPRLARLRTESGLSGDIPSPIDPPSGCAFRTRCPHAMARCAEAAPPLTEVGGGHRAACYLINP